MKKGLVIALIAITALLLWSPWLAEDGGENIIREISQREDVQMEMDRLTDDYGCNADGKECCDGLSSSWAPFGRNVNYCHYATWYVPFWGN